MQLNMKAATCKLGSSGINQQRAPQTMRPAATLRFTAAATIQQQLAAAFVAASTASLLLLSSGAAYARQPPIQEIVGRCTIEALDKFAGERLLDGGTVRGVQKCCRLSLCQFLPADTRATFSLEASGGNMAEVSLAAMLQHTLQPAKGLGCSILNFPFTPLPCLCFCQAVVDIRGCDYSNLDLRGKVLSGVKMQV